jgi:hypothetical protein
VATTNWNFIHHIPQTEPIGQLLKHSFKLRKASVKNQVIGI